ncbi:MAG: hypothetical protein M0C28_11990 [Candidatus Moduliflexus flocculans]|nr:hypothetical protein [Candidatus Moduliflexus flocculans]
MRSAAAQLFTEPATQKLGATTSSSSDTCPPRSPCVLMMTSSRPSM